LCASDGRGILSEAAVDTADATVLAGLAIAAKEMKRVDRPEDQRQTRLPLGFSSCDF
jgi:hypothetical protein